MFCQFLKTGAPKWCNRGPVKHNFLCTLVGKDGITLSKQQNNTSHSWMSESSCMWKYMASAFLQVLVGGT